MEFIARHPHLVLVGAPLAVLVGMLAMLDLGRRIGLRLLERDPEAGKGGLGPLEGSVLGLLGLLVAFTFAGAAGRYDSRRDLVVQEANAIGDAWARLDTLPPELQPPLRDGLRRYLAARLETYGKEIPERLLDPYCQVMVAASTVAHLDDEFWLEPVGTLQLKGKSQGVEVFALMGTKEARAQDRPAASIGARSAAG